MANLLAMAVENHAIYRIKGQNASTMYTTPRECCMIEQGEEVTSAEFGNQQVLFMFEYTQNYGHLCRHMRTAYIQYLSDTRNNVFHM